MAVRHFTMLVVAGGLACAASARAQVTTEQAASILVFPKVVFDGTRDTIIQLGNSANSAVHARCWYVNGALTFPNLPPGPSNQALWQSVDFPILLTKQQPTNWVASRGRVLDSLDPPCNRSSPDCYGAGIDPGAVPAVPQGFAGEMRCVETDAGGSPLSGNHLTGEATLEDVAGGDVSKYSAIGIAGLATNDSDDTLRLGEEYAGCPQTWILDHTADGAEVIAVGPGSATHTELTVVPCSEDLAHQVPESIVVQFTVTSELEQRFSAAMSVRCWRTFQLSDAVFTLDVLGTRSAQTRIRTSALDTSGLFAVAEERRTAGGTSAAHASAAANVDTQGVRAGVDLITLP